MSAAPSNWRVMLNSSLWNQTKYAQAWQNQPEVRRLAQSKGRARMLLQPKQGDTVDFVLKGKIVMKGTVESDGFIEGTAHQEHSCNKGLLRSHADPNEFAWIKITNLLADPIAVRFTGQRTWLRTTEDWATVQ